MIARLLLLARTNASLRAEVNHLRDRLGREVEQVAAVNRALVETNRYLVWERNWANAFIGAHGLGHRYWRERLLAARKRDAA